MELHKIYFYTATIMDWKPLLKSDQYKEIIISSLKNLVDREMIRLYGFVIMPNHVHLIWEFLKLNGKEKPHASFMKFTSHMIQKDLRQKNPAALESFKTDSSTRKYQLWQRDALPIILYSTEVIHQKLDYIHRNPVQGKWTLASSHVDYKFSSAGFYEYGKDEFGFLTHVGACM
jgi:putative transposase